MFRALKMENRVSPFLSNTFNAIFLTSEFCGALSSIVRTARSYLMARKDFNRPLFTLIQINNTKGNGFASRLGILS